MGEQPLRLLRWESEIHEHIATGLRPMTGFRINLHFDVFLSVTTAR